MANTSFPNIKTISEVLPAIEGMAEFNIGNGSQYFDVVDYHIMDSHTFRHEDPDIAAIRRECRGLLFHKDGRIARRGFHKFFNIGETEETFPKNIDLTTGYQLLEKLDGSMIAPFMSKDLGSVYWASMRGSFPYHQRLAHLYDGTDYAHMIEALAVEGLTAIFEFCSQDNRIVVDYPEPQLTLLAIRHLETGHYHSRKNLEAAAAAFNVPVVAPLQHVGKTVDELMTELTDVRDLEGAVLWMNGRPLAKFKGEWYLQLHKLLGHFKFEKDIARLVLSGNTDDLMGILNAEKRAALQNYQDALLAGVKKLTMECETIRDELIASNIDRKSFAVEHGAPKIFKSILFRNFDNLDQAEFFEDILKKALSMTGSFGIWDSFKSSVGLELKWDVDHLG